MKSTEVEIKNIDNNEKSTEEGITVFPLQM